MTVELACLLASCLTCVVYKLEISPQAGAGSAADWKVKIAVRLAQIHLSVGRSANPRAAVWLVDAE